MRYVTLRGGLFDGATVRQENECSLIVLFHEDAAINPFGPRWVVEVKYRVVVENGQWIGLED